MYSFKVNSRKVSKSGDKHSPIYAGPIAYISFINVAMSISTQKHVVLIFSLIRLKNNQSA